MGNYCCGSQHQHQNKQRHLFLPISALQQLQKPITPRILLKDYGPMLKHMISESELQQNGNIMSKIAKDLIVDLFEFIGEGGQGIVYNTRICCRLLENVGSAEFAMKQIVKSHITSKSIKESIVMENLLLGHNSCDFLVKNVVSAENSTAIYYFSEIASIGDLAAIINDKRERRVEFRKCQQENIRWVMAATIVGLEYLHQNKIVYNDLKMENILIFEDGYPKLNDFGCICCEGGTSQSIGTLVYTSPDKLSKNGKSSRMDDIWALGVLLHVLTYYQFPFQTSQSAAFLNQCKSMENKHQILSKKGSPSLKSLLNQLLRVNPKDRIGYKSIQQLKNHSFFNQFSWKKFQTKQLQSPLHKLIKKCPKTPNKTNKKIERRIVFRHTDIYNRILIDLCELNVDKNPLMRTREDISSYHQ